MTVMLDSRMVLMYAYDDDYDEPVEPAPAPLPTIGNQVTYSEIRWWAVYLDIFTASDLADAMGVDLSVGEKGVKALLWHGICEDTGEAIDGPYGSERVIQHAPLPPGPTEHHTEMPPERVVGYTEVLCARGMPVRIRTGRDFRRKLAGSQEARRVLLEQERRYQEMVAAKAARAEKQKAKAQKLPKWKTNK